MTSEQFVMFCLALISVLITIGAGYATLRERIKSNEIHVLYIKEAMNRLDKNITDIMRALHINRRDHVEIPLKDDIDNG